VFIPSCDTVCTAYTCRYLKFRDVQSLHLQGSLRALSYAVIRPIYTA
jgi:hypothetical protein